MKINKIAGLYNDIAKVESDSILINDVQSAIDLIADILYGLRMDYIILNKKHLTKDFFLLKTGLLGDVYQKFSNYAVKVAIVGDFEEYQTENFSDFMFESNKGKTLIFVKTEEEAIVRLNTFK